MRQSQGMEGEFEDDLSTLRMDPSSDANSSGWALKIVQDTIVTTRALSDRGRLEIGRARDADIRIDDPSISRRHALLYVGPPHAIEDLGSANGTKIADRRLSPNEKTEFALGEIVEVGSVMLIVQRARAPSTSAGDRSIADSPRPMLAERGPMAAIDRLVDKIAPGNIGVLLLGETGVGKEVIAERIHARSGRASPMMRINCATLSSGLLESELFGHEKGAFTGAEQQKPGLLELAHGGTVLLDEVGELPLPLQAKLLRVLEDRRVMRVGGVVAHTVDARFIAASNRDLEREVAEGRFRQDLYFRLNGFTIVIPPLRERVEEIAPLARHFAKGAPIAAEAIARLEAYGWPGNVRELEHVIERALLLSEGRTIALEHLPDRIGRGLLSTHLSSTDTAERARGEPSEASRLRAELDALEKQRLIDALTASAGNQTRAAKQLGISRSTLLAKLDAYGIKRPRAKR